MADYKVVTAALRTEAKMWQDHSDKMAPIVQAVKGTYLSAAAFFVGDPVTLAFEAVNAGLQAGEYEAFRGFVEKVLAEAVTEFDQIDGALRRIADAYDKAEEVNEIDLDKYYHA